MFKKFRRISLAPIALAIAAAVYFLPPVHDRLLRRVDDVRTQIKYYFNPPDQAVFLPTQQAAIDAIVKATMQAHALTQTPSPTPKATALQGSPTSAQTATAVLLPEAVSLPGVVYVDQRDRWNYCAIANLTMALKFWGWSGNRDDVAKVVKPGENDPSKTFVDRGFTDKNVMPYELVDYVNNETQYHALLRYGGEIDLLKTMVANGYPVLVEKGIYETDTTNRTSWMGHYLFVTGYDDIAQTLLVQDSYLKGPNYHVGYDDFTQGWRAFDRVFLVVYPAERESDVMSLLGSYADSRWAAQHALDLANLDIKTATGIPLFFDWFARGSSEVVLQQYIDAATSYDQAFSIYATLDPNYSTRPWRMMWYQTGPYWAYYYSGRYQDVLNLANFTLDKTSGQPTLEESLYWRGLAEYAIGKSTAAIGDVQKAVYYNKNFQAALAQLQQWGVP
jgi:tetratricopeptide (TPR) repeat protein